MFWNVDKQEIELKLVHVFILFLVCPLNINTVNTKGVILIPIGVF